MEACGNVTDRNDLLAVFPEHPIQSATLSESFSVHGNVDYVVAKTVAKGKNRENVLNVGEASPQIPHFCVVEAKRDTGFPGG